MGNCGRNILPSNEEILEAAKTSIKNKRGGLIIKLDSDLKTFKRKPMTQS